MKKTYTEVKKEVDEEIQKGSSNLQGRIEKNPEPLRPLEIGIADLYRQDFMSGFTAKIVNDLNLKKQQVILSRLKQLGLTIDVKEESERRFKLFLRYIEGNKETIYYNDGSLNGLRIVTFITEQKPFDPDECSISHEITYY